MENCCCSDKTTLRSDKDKKSLENRINRIIGQLNGIKGMIDEDKYCVDILMQCSAVVKAFEALERLIFESHFKGCVARDIKEGKEEVIDETLLIIERLMR